MSEAVNTLPVKTGDDLPNLTTTEKPFTGAFVGFNEAVRLSGVSKPTFQKYVQKGRLTPTIDDKGKRTFQVVDIFRVFPEGAKATSQDNGKINQTLPEEVNALPEQIDQSTMVKIATLEREKAVLEAELKAEREKGELLKELAEKEARNADDLRQSLKMLTYRPEPAVPIQATQPEPQPQPAPEPKRGFFSRILGGGKG